MCCKGYSEPFKQEDALEIAIIMVVRSGQRCDEKFWKGGSILVFVTVACVAAVLFLWHLSSPYLWQDEAATAVMAQRMLRFGRPLAYDGMNLITGDHFAAEDSKTIDQRTSDPRSSILFYAHRGDFKPDTTWQWQPWGQFVATALSFRILGPTTFAARLPFALASIVTILALYLFILAYFENAQMALLASIFLLTSGYWVLHGRQCRYYALSSLFFMLTLAGYGRWQSRKSWGAVAFIAAAWCWFQVDYGTVWPVLGVLFLDALIEEREKWWRPVLVGLGWTVLVVPFVFYYHIWGRLSVPVGTWHERLVRNVFNTNEFVVPFVVLGGIALVLIFRWKVLAGAERRLIFTGCAVIVMLLLWVQSVTPAPFLRYMIVVAPISCLLAAWLLVRVGDRGRAFTWVGAAIFIFTPWLSMPLHLLRPATLRHATIVRPELRLLMARVFGQPSDPNKPVIDWLAKNAKSDDEILINYEDIPLMFYLPNPIRGGISAFRVEDDAKSAPDFVVLRHSVDFVHWPVYRRELERYRWETLSLQVPDIVCGNCPDPVERYDDAGAKFILVARRISGQGLSSDKQRAP